MFFMPQRTASLSPQGQRGGCGIKKRGGVAAPHSLNSFVSCVLPLLFGFENDDPKKFEETIATPQKRGVPTDPDSGALWHASIPARRGSLSSVFIPAGRLGKDAPERGFKLRSSNPFYSRLEPQPRGAVTRWSVAQRRSRVSGLTRSCPTGRCFLRRGCQLSRRLG